MQEHKDLHGLTHNRVTSKAVAVFTMIKNDYNSLKLQEAPLIYYKHKNQDNEEAMRNYQSTPKIRVGDWSQGSLYTRPNKIEETIAHYYEKWGN